MPELSRVLRVKSMTCIFLSLQEIQDDYLQVPPDVCMAAIPADIHCNRGHESIECHKTLSLTIM